MTSDPAPRTPPPPSASNARGAATREAILDVATRHIARLGFEGLRVRDVAKEVGINNASLHHHYPTKETLIASLIDRFVADFEAAQPRQTSSDREERLAAYLTGTRALMRERPEMFVVLNELLVRAARDHEVARLMAPSQERWLDYLLFLLGDTPTSVAERRHTAERYRFELLGESIALGAEGTLGTGGGRPGASISDRPDLSDARPRRRSRQAR